MSNNSNSSGISILGLIGIVFIYRSVKPIHHGVWVGSSQEVNMFWDGV